MNWTMVVVTTQGVVVPVTILGRYSAQAAIYVALRIVQDSGYVANVRKL